MLAHQFPNVNVNGGSLPTRLGKRPTNFMFIDSSNGGVNAKPDKLVRSFVMKSARNKKAWSTRPKSPKDEALSSERSCRQPSSQLQTCNKPKEYFELSPRLGCDVYTTSWDKQGVTSPSSSSNYSLFSGYSSNRTCHSPLSTYTSPYAERHYQEDFYSCPEFAQPAYAHRPKFICAFTDSFGCLPVQMDASMEQLLHQFVEASAPRLFPIDPHSSSREVAIDWIARCILSPLGAPFIYAALSSSARATRHNADSFKWRAISEVNRLLSDPSNSTNDTTIAAVLVLLALEEAELANPIKKGDERRCSVDMNEAHLNGLQTMIGQRGGLAALGENRCLQVCILMYSVAHSITTFKRPYALLRDDTGKIEDYRPLSYHSPEACSHVLQRLEALGIDPALLDIVSTLAVFTCDLKVWYDTGTSPVDALVLQKHTSLLLYRLFDWYEQSTVRYDVSPMDQSICLASLIYLVFATEPHTPGFGSRLAKCLTKLCQSVYSTPLAAWTGANEVLLWTMTMGALGAKTLSKNAAPSLSFFERYSKAAFADHAPTTAEHLISRMQDCLWIPFIFEARAQRWWVSMGLCGSPFPDLEDTSSTSGEGEVVEDEYALGQSTAMRFFSQQQGSAVNKTVYT